MRTALVTGAAGGIGSATARRLATDGFAVLLTDIEVGKGQQIAAEIVATGATAKFLYHDVCSEQSWLEALGQADVPLGVVINNAGIGDMNTIEDTDLAAYERTIAVTQTGMFLGMKHGGQALLQAGGGSIVNISSIFGVSGGFGTSPGYHAAKGAVRTLTKNVALRWADQGIRVNSVHPGFIATEGVLKAAKTPFGEMMITATPMGRLGLPEEVAAAVSFLASEQSSFITGSELYVDGGYTAR